MQIQSVSGNSQQNPLTPALCRLVYLCHQLKTTEAKVLAAHLHKSPATIRTEFQRVMCILNVHCRYAAIRMAEENGWLQNPDIS